MGTFFIGDTHFGHRSILMFKRSDGTALRDFPNIHEHDKTIVERWNDTVSANDVVYHMGDVLFDKRYLSLIGRLRGHKHLIMGNHDNVQVVRYIEAGFVKVRGAQSLIGPNKEKIVLTHIPIHPQSMGQRYDYNIHGHLHYGMVKDADGIPDRRYINVSAEMIDFRPVAIETLFKGDVNGTLD